jgi:hypothetical protein
MLADMWTCWPTGQPVQRPQTFTCVST